MSKKPLSDFDSSVKYLLEVSSEIHDKLHGNSSSKTALWMSWTNKFTNAYAKKNQPEFFYSMFITFFNKYISNFSMPIFTKETPESSVTVNDIWLKNEEYLPGPGFVQPQIAVAGSWTPSEARCKGVVIYFNDNEKFAAVSIPISEIYRAACKLYKREGDANCKLYPAKVLIGLYSIIYYVLPDIIEQKIIIKSNIDELREHLEISSPASESAINQDNIGSGLAGLSKIMSQVMKSAGIDNSGFDENTLPKMLGGAINEKSINTVGKVVKEVVNAVSGPSEDGGKQDIGSMLGKIGKALQTDTVKDAISGISEFTKKQNDELIATIPGVEDCKISAEDQS